MTQQLLALRSWTIGSDSNWAGVLVKWVWTVVSRVQQSVCSVRGHDTIRCSEDNHLVLRCMHCGHTSPGWKIGRQASPATAWERAYDRAVRPLTLSPMSQAWRSSLPE